MVHSSFRYDFIKDPMRNRLAVVIAPATLEFWPVIVLFSTVEILPCRKPRTTK